MRDGQIRETTQNEVLVGDLFIINPGDIAPADGILVRCFGIYTD